MKSLPQELQEILTDDGALLLDILSEKYCPENPERMRAEFLPILVSCLMKQMKDSLPTPVTQ